MSEPNATGNGRQYAEQQYFDRQCIRLEYSNDENQMGARLVNHVFNYLRIAGSLSSFQF